jgi:glutathione S-transferase
MSHAFDIATSLLASAAEQGRGIQITSAGRQPQELLELYDMEGCPFCRVVREALTDLDIDVMIYPCPKNGGRFRPLVERLGGKQQFPFLFDPNTDVTLYESADIVEYLYGTYGGRPAPGRWRLKAIRTPASFAASVLRRGRGIQADSNSRDADEPLELFSFEASPFARLVRERLTELELPHIIRQVGRDNLADWMPPPLREKVMPDYQPSQRNRQLLMQRAGRMAVPYLIDPNTGQEMFESGAILDYLERTYG